MLTGMVNNLSSHTDDRFFVRSEMVNGKPITLAVFADRGCASEAKTYFQAFWEDKLPAFLGKHRSSAKLRAFLDNAIISYISGHGFETYRHNFVEHHGHLALLLSCGKHYVICAVGGAHIYKKTGDRFKLLLSSPEAEDANTEEYMLCSDAGLLFGNSTFLLCEKKEEHLPSATLLVADAINISNENSETPPPQSLIPIRPMPSHPIFIHRRFWYIRIKNVFVPLFTTYRNFVHCPISARDSLPRIHIQAVCQGA